MIIDLNPMLRGEVKTLEIAVSPVTGEIPSDYEPLPGSEIKGTITCSGGYIRLESVVTVPYRGTCARCLDPVEDKLTFRFDRTLVTEGTLSSEVLEENPDEYVLLRGGFLDTDEAVSESVFIEFPMMVLCSPDCPGLCPRCGRRLSKGIQCSCSKNEKEPDPRWNCLKGLNFDD
ncbi:MAG: DUF177 domain-containing protein [Clostridia bacterium]|nr:DUF177 domain-containing protein [Clostridia bacterium]